MPAPVRQTYATGKGVIGEAEKPDAPLTFTRQNRGTFSTASVAED